jgi:hypothetical protein
MRRLLLLLALGASAARADSGWLSVGAGISENKVSHIVNASTSFADIDATSWKVFAALRPASVFAIEADYLGLSHTSTYFRPGVGACAVNVPNCALATYKSTGNAFVGYAVGFLPIPLPLLDVFGKAGLSRWKLNDSALVGSTLAPVSSFSSTGSKFAWGVGTQVHVGNFGARLEYESFRIPSTNGANVISLTVFLNLY